MDRDNAPGHPVSDPRSSCLTLSYDVVTLKFSLGYRRKNYWFNLPIKKSTILMPCLHLLTGFVFYGLRFSIRISGHPRCLRRFCLHVLRASCIFLRGSDIIHCPCDILGLRGLRTDIVRRPYCDRAATARRSFDIRAMSA